MKYFKLLAALICFISTNVLFAQSDEVNSEQIIVRMFEINTFAPSTILISYGDGNVESVDIKSMASTKIWQHNLNILHIVLDRIRNQGYTMIQTIGAGGDGLLTTTYIFLRNDLVKETGSIYK